MPTVLKVNLVKMLMVLMLVPGILLTPFTGLFHGIAWAATPDPVELERIPTSSIPPVVAEWVDSVKERQGLHRLNHDGRTWVMVAWGEKPTGGYEVTIEEAERTATGVIVFSVDLSSPEPDALVSQVITYPYDLVAIPETTDPLAADFGSDRELWVPPRTDGIPPVSAKVFLQEPQPGTILDNSVRIKGAAQLFEGTFHVVLEDGHNQLVNQLGTASAGGPEWGVIDMELEFPSPTSAHGLLIIMWQNPEDGSWVEELAVPVRFNNVQQPDNDADPPVFSDVDGHWASSPIKEAVDRGFVNGYPDGSFKPNNPITRAEFLKMLLSALEIDPGQSRGPVSFNDIADHWVAGYVQEGILQGIITVDEYGSSFQPDRNITRLEIATQAVRALDGKGQPSIDAGNLPPFADTTQLDDDAKQYIATAAHLGILKGYPDGTVKPQHFATRAEAVTIVLRMLEVLEK